MSKNKYKDQKGEKQTLEGNPTLGLAAGGIAGPAPDGLLAPSDEEIARLRADLAAVRDALQREKQRADAHDKERNEAALQVEALKKQLLGAAADAAPMSSPRAAELVLLVPPQDRMPLLGDLLEMLMPFAGETGANESAADALRRKLASDAESQEVEHQLREALRYAEQHRDAAMKRAETIQAAMVARRATDADGELRLAEVIQALGPASALLPGLTTHALAAQVVREWQGLRGFLSPLPLVAVAVQDESTQELKERYTLLLLEWDGRKLSTTAVERRASWRDVRPRLDTVLATRLIPPTFRE
jgi:Skp family chaperone for outer membrane proteins